MPSGAQAVAGVMGGGASEVSPAHDRRRVSRARISSRPRSGARRGGWACPPRRRIASSAAPTSTMPVRALARVAATARADRRAAQCAPASSTSTRRHACRSACCCATIASQRLLGYPVDAVDVERILSSPRVRRSSGSTRPSLTWQATVPFWRVDVAREADLIEEVARHLGYDRLPATFPRADQGARAPGCAARARARRAQGGARGGLLRVADLHLRRAGGRAALRR